MRGKTGEMERVRNERMGQKGKKDTEMEMNVGEEEQETADRLSEMEPRPRVCQSLVGLGIKKKCF